MFPIGSLVSKAPELWVGRVIGAGITFKGTRVYMVQMIADDYDAPRIFIGTERDLAFVNKVTK